MWPLTDAGIYYARDWVKLARPVPIACSSGAVRSRSAAFCPEGALPMGCRWHDGRGPTVVLSWAARAADTGEGPNEHSRVSGEGALEGLRHRGAARRRRLYALGGRGRGPRAGGGAEPARLGGEGADPRWRPRQSGRDPDGRFG